MENASKERGAVAGRIERIPSDATWESVTDSRVKLLFGDLEV